MNCMMLSVTCVGGRGADLPGQTEVRDLDHVWAGAQDVLGLQVSVEKSITVHVCESLQYLEHNSPNC